MPKNAGVGKPQNSLACPLLVWTASGPNSQRFARPGSVVLFTSAGLHLRCGWRPSAVRDQRAFGPRVVPTRSASPDRECGAFHVRRSIPALRMGDHPRSGTRALLDCELSQLAGLRQVGECGAFHVRRSIPALRMETIRGPGPARVWTASGPNSQHFASPESVVLFTSAGINLRCGWRPSAVRDHARFWTASCPNSQGFARPESVVLFTSAGHIPALRMETIRGPGPARFWTASGPNSQRFARPGSVVPFTPAGLSTCAADGDHPRSGIIALLIAVRTVSLSILARRPET